jgi:deoxyinosine 3'endonuclease (endonuclease V)|tara:strand:+ start:249 stop:467 length:219 start_codon:yes stop_codon:yes gene_type:complete
MLMSRTKLISDFRRLIEIEKERNEALKEVSKIIGFDISFSDEQIIKNAQDILEQKIVKSIQEDMSKWMKSLS